MFAPPKSSFIKVPQARALTQLYQIVFNPLASYTAVYGIHPFYKTANRSNETIEGRKIPSNYNHVWYDLLLLSPNWPHHSDPHPSSKSRVNALLDAPSVLSFIRIPPPNLKNKHSFRNSSRASNKRCKLSSSPCMKYKRTWTYVRLRVQVEETLPLTRIPGRSEMENGK